MFVNLVVEELAGSFFETLEVEDIELLDEKLAKPRSDASVEELAESLDRDNPVVMGTFHAYKQADQKT